MVKYSQLPQIPPDELKALMDAAMETACAPTEIPEDPKMTFYCKDCQKIIDNPIKQGKIYEYQCPECQGFRVVFGTKNAIANYFKPDQGGRNAY